MGKNHKQEILYTSAQLNVLLLCLLDDVTAAVGGAAQILVLPLPSLLGLLLACGPPALVESNSAAPPGA